MTASNASPSSPDAGQATPASHAAELYGRISADQDLTQALFRQALQDPNGAVSRIVDIGAACNLPVTAEEVRLYIASLDDNDSKQWLVKARGGL
jgi:hypothetical protein